MAVVSTGIIMQPPPPAAPADQADQSPDGGDVQSGGEGDVVAPQTDAAKLPGMVGEVADAAGGELNEPADDAPVLVWVGAAAPKKQADRPQGLPLYRWWGFAQYLPPFDNDTVRD